MKYKLRSIISVTFFSFLLSNVAANALWEEALRSSTKVGQRIKVVTARRATALQGRGALTARVKLHDRAMSTLNSRGHSLRVGHVRFNPLLEKACRLTGVASVSAAQAGKARRNFSDIRKNDLQLETEMGRWFERVITHEREGYKPIGERERHLLMLTRWTTGLHFSGHERFLLRPYSIAKANDAPNPHYMLHKTLGNRAQGMLAGLKQVYTLQYPEDPKIDLKGRATTAGLDSRADHPGPEGVATNFVDGHYYSLKGITRSPKLFVTAFEPERGRYSKNWFLPIEQGLICATMKEYMNSTALLKKWGAYSGLGLAVIPEKTYVSLRFGLVAPQTFPRWKKEKWEITSGTQAQHMIDEIDLEDFSQPVQPNETWNFYERRPGGATQFYIAYACPLDEKGRTPEDPEYVYGTQKPLSIYNMDALYLAGRKLSNSHLERFKFPKHASDPTYPGVEIRIHEALKDMGLLENCEYLEFEKVLKEYVNKGDTIG